MEAIILREITESWKDASVDVMFYMREVLFHRFTKVSHLYKSWLTVQLQPVEKVLLFSQCASTVLRQNTNGGVFVTEAIVWWPIVVSR